MGVRPAGDSNYNVGFNPQTHQFERAQKASQKTVKLEQKVAKVRVPPDRSSQTFLQRTKTKLDATGAPLKSSTKGVLDYFSGKGKYTDFIASMKTKNLLGGK